MANADKEIGWHTVRQTPEAVRSVTATATSPKPPTDFTPCWMSLSPFRQALLVQQTQYLPGLLEDDIGTGIN